MSYAQFESCPISPLAREALAIIKRFDDADDADLARLVDIENEAIKHVPSSRIGLVFQAALVTTLVDCIEAAVPSDSEWAAQSASHLRAIDRISRSIVASLASTPATADERDLCNYYLPHH